MVTRSVVNQDVSMVPMVAMTWTVETTESVGVTNGAVVSTGAISVAVETPVPVGDGIVGLPIMGTVDVPCLGEPSERVTVASKPIHC